MCTCTTNKPRQLPTRYSEELGNVEVTNLDFAIERDDDDGQGDKESTCFIRNLLERFGLIDACSVEDNKSSSKERTSGTYGRFY